MAPIIEIEKLRRVYSLGGENVVALKDINLTIERGDICCILGTSGSGKSTFLNMVAGLEKPSHGVVKINGTDIIKLNEKKMTKFRQNHIGFIFQSYNLMNDISSTENVAMPLIFRGVSKKVRERAAAQLLHAVGLGDRTKHKPKEMSGGQQQRVGIARAFVSKPDIIFADEPTGNLDTKTTDIVMRMMAKMVKSSGQTLIIVTHDDEIAEYCDRILTLVDGEIVSDKKNDNVKGVD